MSEHNLLDRGRLAGAATGELAAGLGALIGLIMLLRYLTLSPAPLHLSALVIYLGMAGLVFHFWPARRGLGWANRVTLARGVLVALVAGTLAAPDFAERNAWAVFAIALLALGLDGLDGLVARRTGSETRFGARFDMELDAFFILALCLLMVLQEKAGAWVIAIGAMRYLFVLAAYAYPWLGAELPVSYRRKAVCVCQVSALMICLLPFVTPVWSSLVLSAALGLLALSFILDIVRLARRASKSVHF